MHFSLRMARKSAKRSTGEGPGVERRLEELAARQHWVVGRRQLLGLGLTAAFIDARVARGRLVALHVGVYTLGPRPVLERGRLMAAVLACRDRTLVAGNAAAFLWELERLRPGPVDVLTTSASRSKRGVRVHHAPVLHAEDAAMRDGIPVTSLPRTLIDLAGHRDERAIARLVEEADRLRLLSVAGLHRACARAGPRPGIGRLRSVLDSLQAPEPTRRELERALP